MKLRTILEILRRLATQPGVVLADEVGMGKTFVALGVAMVAALADRGRRPVVIMVPSSLHEKWPRDFDVFKVLRSGFRPTRPFAPRLRIQRSTSSA